MPKYNGTGPTLGLSKKSGYAKLSARLKKLSTLAAYVGVPASNSRKQQLMKMANTSTGKRKQRALKSAKSQVNNAELLFIHTNGSPARHIPARPVLQPAVMAAGNREAIANQLALATKANLEGKPEEAQKRMQKTGMAGQNAARNWFTDPRNNWPPDAPATVAAKGSDRPLIDTGALRASIVYVVKDGDTVTAEGKTG